MSPKIKQRVYVLRNVETNVLKIGITNNIKRRVNNLQNAGGCKLVIEFLSINTELARKIEHILHFKLKKNKTLGEWFNVSLSSVLTELNKLKVPNASLDNLDDYHELIALTK